MVKVKAQKVQPPRSTTPSIPPESVDDLIKGLRNLKSPTEHLKSPTEPVQVVVLSRRTSGLSGSCGSIPIPPPTIQYHYSTTVRPTIPPKPRSSLPSDPMVKVFNISIISDMIFGRVSVNDMHSCRLVNKKFNKITTLSLQRRMAKEKFKIAFKYEWNLGIFVRDYGSEGTGRAYKDRVSTTTRDYLDTLNLCLDTKGKFNSFPCNHFAFELGHIASRDLKMFLSLFGHRLESLTVSNEKLEDLRNYFDMVAVLYVLNKIPNIEILDIPWIIYPSDYKEARKLVKQHQQIPLPKLRYLYLSCSSGFNLLLQKIVTGAPGLIKCERIINNQCASLQCNGFMELFRDQSIMDKAMRLCSAHPMY